MYLSMDIYVFLHHHKELFPAKNLCAYVHCHLGLGCKEARCHGYFDNPNMLC